MPRFTLSAFSALGLCIALASPASAQNTGGNEKMNMVIVYGDDPCPASSDPHEITVCARKDEGERFRIPENLRESTSPQNNAWTNRATSFETVGAAGVMSCSPVGSGGWAGCTQKLIHDAYAEKKANTDVRFSELAAKEREKRDALIDGEAASTQSRVEQAEKEYEARARAEEEAKEAKKVEAAKGK
jgi:hypothetical protein